MFPSPAKGPSRPSTQPSSEADIELPMLEADGKLHSSSSGPCLDVDDLPSSSGRTQAEPLPPSGQEEMQDSSGGGVLTSSIHFFIRNWERFLLLMILIVLLVLVSVKGFTVFGDILKFFQRQNNWLGWACFLGLYCINVALFLPGIVLILGAGFVFGFWKGVLAVWLGGGVGQALAFLLARYLVQDSVSVLVKGRWRKWEVIDKAIEKEGWKLLVLLRLSPLVPYNLLNITMAATKIHFWPFAIASFFGIIPECSLLCYMGSLAENVTQVVSGGAGPKGSTTFILAGITLLLLISSATWATLFVRRAMKRAEQQLRGDEGEDLESGELPDAGHTAGLSRPTHGAGLRPTQSVGSEARSAGGTTPARQSSDHAQPYYAVAEDEVAWNHPPQPPQRTSLLQTAALVTIPGLAPAGTTRVLISEAVRGTIGTRVSESGDVAGADVQRLDSLEAHLLPHYEDRRDR